MVTHDALIFENPAACGRFSLVEALLFGIIVSSGFRILCSLKDFLLVFLFFYLTVVMMRNHGNITLFLQVGAADWHLRKIK